VPLSNIPSVRSRKSGEVLYRVGCFLIEDGKYHEASQLIEKAVKIIAEMNGSEHAE
jgi:Tfp pilus assembly protein PilF